MREEPDGSGSGERRASRSRSPRRKQGPRGSGDGDSPEYKLDKINMLTAFLGCGSNVGASRLDDAANNIFLGGQHVFGVAKISPDLIVLLGNTWKYRVLTTECGLAIFVHRHYLLDFEIKATGGRH